jgi:hypothetical protein
MPFMQRLTWSGIAMHAGVVPGYPASHGCIRLPAEFASKMWGLTRIGMRVIIAPNDVTPIEIAHARLPEPHMTAVPVAAAAVPVQTAAMGTPSQTDGGPQLVDPLRLAQMRRAETLGAHAEAQKNVRPAFDTAREKSMEASRASVSLRAAERLTMTLGERLAALDSRREGGAQLTPVVAAAGDPTAQLRADLDAAQKSLSAARVMEVAASDAAFAAARAAREAEEEAARLADELKAIPSTLEPISIFVSKKEGRVFFRQGFTPLFDEPIVLTDPERPLGTHVFTAIASSDNSGKLKWLATTISAAPPERNEERPTNRRQGRQAANEPPSRLPASDAARSLDRFSFSEEARTFIAERLWVGASMIVSDYGPGLETGKGTDFVIQPR